MTDDRSPFAQSILVRVDGAKGAGNYHLYVPIDGDHDRVIAQGVLHHLGLFDRTLRFITEGEEERQLMQVRLNDPAVALRLGARLVEAQQFPDIQQAHGQDFLVAIAEHCMPEATPLRLA